MTDSASPPHRALPKNDLYDVLGVTFNASAKDIRRAFKALSLKHHPDKQKPPPATSTTDSVGSQTPPVDASAAAATSTATPKTYKYSFADITEANEWLSDDELRRQYDDSIRDRAANRTRREHFDSTFYAEGAERDRFAKAFRSWAKENEARAARGESHTAFRSDDELVNWAASGPRSRDGPAHMRRARIAAARRVQNAVRMHVNVSVLMPLKHFMCAGTVAGETLEPLSVETTVLLPCEHRGYEDTLCFQCEESDLCVQPYTACVKTLAWQRWREFSHSSSEDTIVTRLFAGVVGVRAFGTREAHAPVLHVVYKMCDIPDVTKYTESTLPPGVAAAWWLRPGQALTLGLTLPSACFTEYVQSQCKSLDLRWFDGTPLPVEFDTANSEDPLQSGQRTGTASTMLLDYGLLQRPSHLVATAAAWQRCYMLQVRFTVY